MIFKITIHKYKRISFSTLNFVLIDKLTYVSIEEEYGKLIFINITFVIL